MNDVGELKKSLVETIMDRVQLEYKNISTQEMFGRGLNLLIKASSVQAKAEARQAALEEACKAKCLWCEKGVDIVLDEGDGPGDELYMHELIKDEKEYRVECSADFIRRLMEQG